MSPTFSWSVATPSAAVVFSASGVAVSFCLSTFLILVEFHIMPFSAAGGTIDKGQRELQRNCASPAVARNAQGAGAETASVRDNFTTGVLSNLRSRRRTRTAERRRSSMPKQQKGPAAVGSHGEDFVEGDRESAGEGSAEGRLAVGIAALAKDLVGALDST